MGGPPPLPSIEGQTYCLRWNNHKSNLVEILDVLIKVESYVDCTIVVDDQVQFKAHRVVLAANSPYFQSILQDVPMDHCSIIFPGVKAFEMRALLEYMYTGEVNVTQSQIPKIMRIAEELEVKGLFDMADLKEKFNRLSEEHTERPGNPYGCYAPIAPYSTASTLATTSSSASSSSAAAMAAAAAVAAATTEHNGAKDPSGDPHQQNSSSVISTSSNISPSAAPSSSSSPPYSSYKSPYSSLYTKSPGAGPSATASSAAAAAAATSSVSTAQTTTHTQSHNQQQSGNANIADRSQWPLSPSAAAAAMLSSVYESASDMNPLKRKKLSSISSMLMNRDTPILRNVLAQANPADSSQPMPLLLPGAIKSEKSSTEKSSPHAAMVGAQNNSHSFNGTDYNNDKKYPDEPHSPFTDRSFDDESFDVKGNFTGSFVGSNANQKPEWKRYKQYTRNDIMSAIQCVRDGMSALQASRKFGVPSRTLYDKVKKLGITTGRPMNRTMKRSPSNVESSAAFPYAHGYGQSEPLLSSMHETGNSSRVGDDRERESKDHLRTEHHHHHMPPTIQHPAAALLDHAFLQQALENRGGDIAGREALHAMALAAAAHAAANRMSASPGPNGNAARSPSPPNFGGGSGGSGGGMKYGRHGEHEMLLEREKERRMLENEMERERELIEMEREHERRHRERLDIDDDDDEEDNQVEDLSVTRKDCSSPESNIRDSSRRMASPVYTPSTPTPPPPPPPPPPASLSMSSTTTTTTLSSSMGSSSENGSGVIMPPINSNNGSSLKLHAMTNTSSADEFINESAMKREIISSDDGRAD